MLDQVFIRSTDTVGKDSARLVINDQTSENDEDRRTVGRGCFSMGISDHERCRSDHIDHTKDSRGQDTVLHAFGCLAVLTGIPDPLVDAVEKVHICHHKNGKENTEDRAEILAVSGEYFRKEKKQHRAGA